MGNFSRNTFDKLKHYVGVRLQQGVPLVDADWNELEDIRKYEFQAFLKWFVGNGVPQGNDGFRIVAIPANNDFIIKGGDGTTDGAGRILVEGWETINENNLRYTQQSSLPPLSPPASGTRTDTVYLDIWEREVNGGEDTNLVNPAIGIETCVRTKREWVVRVAEGAPPSPGAGHVFYPLARLNRAGASIQATEITDLRRTGLMVLSAGMVEIFGPIKSSFNGSAGTLFFSRTTESGAPTGVATDGFRIRYDDNFFGNTQDALIIEKTDSNNANPDGGIAFVNTGNDGVVEPSLVIKGDGKVGIGTPGPEQLLHLLAASNPTLKIQSDGTNEISGRLSLRQSDNTGADIYYDGRDSLDGLAIETFSGNASQGVRMFIKNNGNIGIGTSAPSYKLDVRSENTQSGGQTFALKSLASSGRGAEARGVFGVAAVSEDGNVRGVHGEASINSPSSSANGFVLGVSGIAAGNAPSGVKKYGVYGTTTGTGTNYAGYFEGRVRVTGLLEKPGGGFLIDHPLDPKNKTLRHNFVESPENLCLYRGKVKLDAEGKATVKMPDYFAALTKEEEATVNLTPMGKKAIPLSYEWNKKYTAFTIFGEANAEVSYLVLSDRDDPAIHVLAEPVEQKKGNGHHEKDKYLCPEAYGESRELDIQPQMKMRLKEMLE